MKRTLIVLAVIAVIGIVGWSAYHRITYKPPYRIAADQFMAAIARRDTTASYGMLSDNLKKAYTSDGWKQSINEAFANYNGTPKYERSETVADASQYGANGDPHGLRYDLGNLAGQHYHMYIIIFNQKNSWKINQFNSYVQ